MGDCVGTLSFGIILTTLKLSDQETSVMTLIKAKQFQIPDELKVYRPYETEDYLLIVKKSQTSEYDTSALVSHHIATSVVVDDAKKLIDDVLTRHGVVFSPSDIGWILSGHYN